MRYDVYAFPNKYPLIWSTDSVVVGWIIAHIYNYVMVVKMKMKEVRIIDNKTGEHILEI